MPFALPLYNLTLVGGALSTTFILSHMVTLTQLGVMQLVNQKLGPIDLSAEQRGRMFKYHLENNGYWARSISVLSAALNLTTAYLHPNPLVRRLTLGSGIASLAVLPLTFALGILKINGEIVKKDKEGAYKGLEKGSAEDKRLTELTQSWEGKHRVRYLSFVGGWAFNFAALMVVLGNSVL